MIEAVAAHVPVEKLGGHYHDTYGQAIANVLASLEMGVASFDSSVAGLGGCPYSPGATGNVASEDVLYLLDGLGIETGVSMDRLLEAAEYICGVLGRPTHSRAGRAILAKRKREQGCMSHRRGAPLRRGSTARRVQQAADARSSIANAGRGGRAA